VLCLLGVSAAGAARPGDALREDARALDTRAHSALLDLYALDSQLHAANARLSLLESQTAQLRREQAQLAERISVTRHTLAASQARLGQNLTLLYKQGDVDELAVVLGAESLDEAVTRVDDLNRVADQSRQFVDATTEARGQLATLSATLADRRARAEANLADARRTESSLEHARADRLAFISRVRSEAQLKRAQVLSLEAAAERVVHKSSTLQAAATPDPSTTTAAPAESATAVTDSAPAVEPAASSGRTITVSSTGYSLPGHTATGMPVGWGVVAVDPAVIPLGTRLTIPGYGEAVAADTGGAVRGATIDLWFPTLAQARAWGRRTVTITLH
jgi:cystine transport system substrate-binding protein